MTAPTLRTQILYGIGEIPITLTMGLVGTFVLFFYNSVMGLPAALAGAGLTAGLVIDAFIDPYIGLRSDRSRHRMGRRHIFMLTGAIAAGPCFWLMMSPPRGLSQTALFFWLLLSSVAFRCFMASYRIPYLSLGAELTSDYHLRTRIIAIRSLLGLGGMLAGAALPFLLFFPVTADGSDPKLAYAGYPRMGAFFGGMMTVAGLAAVLGTGAQRTFGDASESGKLTGFFSTLAELLRNREYRVLWFCFLLAILSLVLNFSLTVQFLTWYAQIPESGNLSIIQTCLYGGAAAGVTAWIWLARRGEKRNLFLASTLGLAGALCGAAFLFGPGHLFGTGNPVPLMVGNLVAGLFASALWVLPFSMMADVVDAHQLATGARREGAAFGMMNFGEKLAGGVALLISGVLLNFYVGLDPASATQSPEAISRIGLSYGVVPGIVLAAAALLTLGYGLNRARVRDIQARLSGQSARAKAETHHA